MLNENEVAAALTCQASAVSTKGLQNLLPTASWQRRH